MDDLLRFIRIYGHDFLNHLQVISGYVQLHKTEHIREYIVQVASEIRDINMVIRTTDSQTAAGLLGLREQAARYGVPLVIKLEGELSSIADNGLSMRQALASLGRLFPALEGIEDAVTLTVAGGGEPAISLAFPVTAGVLGTALERAANDACRHLAVTGGTIEVGSTMDGVAIHLWASGPGMTPQQDVCLG